VNCADVKDLTIELLAPGGEAGRLTVWTQDALAALDKQGLYYA